MKFFGLLTMAAAAVALPLLDNVGAGHTKELPVLTRIGDRKTYQEATGPQGAKGAGNVFPDVTEIDSFTISKRDAAPLSELTVGVQGGEVVKRDAKKVAIDRPFGRQGIQAHQLLGSVPGILKRWIGMDAGEATNGIEKRQRKTMQENSLGKGASALKKGKNSLKPEKRPLSDFESMNRDDRGTGGADIVGVALPLRAKKE